MKAACQAISQIQLDSHDSLASTVNKCSTDLPVGSSLYEQKVRLLPYKGSREKNPQNDSGSRSST